MLNLTMPERFIPESEISGEPHRIELDVPNYRGYDWKPVEWSQIVRDGDGDIIFTHTQCKAMVRMLREALGMPLFSVYFLDAGRNYPDQAALGLPEGMTLDAEGRAAVSMAAWLNAIQFPGIKRTDFPLLPDDMNEYAVHPDSPVALDAVFYNMDDANQMASLLSTLYGAKPKVVRDGRRWGVVIHDERFLNSTRVIELAGIHKLLSKYRIEPKSDASSKDIEFTERFEAQATFEARIEGGIAAILAHLGHPEAPDRESIPSAHNDPQRAAKGGKTASSKSAPVAVDVFDEGGGNGDKHRLPAPSRKSAKSSAKSK